MKLSADGDGALPIWDASRSMSKPSLRTLRSMRMTEYTHARNGVEMRASRIAMTASTSTLVVVEPCRAISAERIPTAKKATKTMRAATISVPQAGHHCFRMSWNERRTALVPLRFSSMSTGMASVVATQTHTS